MNQRRHLARIKCTACGATAATTALELTDKAIGWLCADTRACLARQNERRQLPLFAEAA